MGGKNKGGREDRKPKADKNKRVSGQTPAPGAIAAINHTGPPKK